MEYTQKRYRCDFCKHDVKSSNDLIHRLPSGWQESCDFYGNIWHSCADPACQMKMSHFNKENGYQPPETAK